MVATNYVWNPVFDCITKETSDAGAVTVRYTQEPKLYGGLISQHRSGATSIYHYDAIGTTRALTDSSQNVTDTAVYTAFGEKLATTGTTQNEFEYVGEIGYFTFGDRTKADVRNRTYHLGNFRWLSRDPAFDENNDSNPYMYAINSPNSQWDPTGLVPLNATDDPLKGLIDQCKGAIAIGNAIAQGITQEMSREMYCQEFLAIYRSGVNFTDPEKSKFQKQHNFPDIARLRSCGVFVFCDENCPSDGHTAAPSYRLPCAICLRSNVRRTLWDWMGIFIHEARHAEQLLDTKTCHCAGGRRRPPNRPPGGMKDLVNMTCPDCERWERSAYRIQAILYFPNDPLRQRIFIERGVCSSCRERCRNVRSFRRRCTSLGIVIRDPARPVVRE